MKTTYTYFWGLAVALAMVAVLMALNGCTGQRALAKHAVDLPSAVKVGLLNHNALGEVAIAVKEDPLVSSATKTLFRDAYRKTVCSKVELANGVGTGSCTDGPSQTLERAGRAFEAFPNAQTEAELSAALDALSAALIDLINLAGGKS